MYSRMSKPLMSRKSFIILLAVIVVAVIAIGIGFSKPQKDHTTKTSTVAAVNKPLVPAVYTSIQGKSISLVSYHNKKLMIYLLATWCSSCQASLQTLLSNAPTLQKDGLDVVSLETYGDAGYSGPSMRQFLSSINNTNVLPNNFTFGNASQALTSSYNPTNAPDIYYLVNPDGVIEAVNSTPSATIQTILQFAKGA